MEILAMHPRFFNVGVKVILYNILVEMHTYNKHAQYNNQFEVFALVSHEL